MNYTPPPDAHFDEEAADFVCSFIETYCILPELGALFVLQPWQREIIRTAYGWMNPDGTRCIRTIFIEVPKKNGKSSLSAALSLYHLCADGEMAGQVYSVASTKKQASIIFDTSKLMVKPPESMTNVPRKLSKIIKPYKLSLIHEKSGSAFHVLTADADTNDGINASAYFFDELHRQRDRRLWDTLRNSGAARRQPMCVVTTTAGDDRHSIGYEVHDYAVRVRDGKHSDTTFLPCIFAADESDDISTVETMLKAARKANPNLGISITEQDLIDKYLEASAMPGSLAAWKRFRLNLWMQPETAAIPAHVWERNNKNKIEMKAMTGRIHYPGLDISQVTDLTAYAMLFPFEDGRKGYDVVVKHWMPRANVIEAEKRDGVPYREWAKQGWLELSEGNAIDYQLVRKKINELNEQHPAADDIIQCDPTNAWQLMQDLDNDGFETVGLSQRYEGMADATAELLKLLAEGQLNFGNNPLMTWQAECFQTIQESGGDRIRPSKGKGKLRKRIDGLCATIIALDRAMRMQGRPVQKRQSIYSTRGVIRI